MAARRGALPLNAGMPGARWRKLHQEAGGCDNMSRPRAAQRPDHRAPGPNSGIIEAWARFLL